MRGLTNLVPAMVLRSPAHRLMSRKYALISFAGRRSGRRYTTPVAYVREGNRVSLSTDSAWWRNLSGGAPVELRLKGKVVSGVGTVIGDEQEAIAALRCLVDAIPSYARPARLRRIGGRVPDEELTRAVRAGRRSIKVELSPPRKAAP